MCSIRGSYTLAVRNKRGADIADAPSADEVNAPKEALGTVTLW